MDQSSPSSPPFFSVPFFLKQYRRFRRPRADSHMEPLHQGDTQTDFGKLVIDAFAGMTRTNGAIDQRLLRYYLSLASSYLVLDSSTNSEGGIESWSQGLNRLVDVLVALHRRDELELETVSEASKACSECWSVAGSWRGLDECRDNIRNIAGKLKTLLDANGRTFKGQKVYAP
ncbi:hypothetical protein BD410DRAFT_779906 [Rickenella mellea]|uniref:Uncharacterized protein n=1 Tax=Rickenella mellea TaxID=50990 RepID=A0A4R5XGI2_9AGAM|nr:hypothetical protein BD410DRAFT_779906 [Rickenella mellea]